MCRSISTLMCASRSPCNVFAAGVARMDSFGSTELTVIPPPPPRYQQYVQLPPEMPAKLRTAPCLSHDVEWLLQLATSATRSKALPRSKLWACRTLYVCVYYIRPRCAYRVKVGNHFEREIATVYGPVRACAVARARSAAYHHSWRWKVHR